MGSHLPVKKNALEVGGCALIFVATGAMPGHLPSNSNSIMLRVTLQDRLLVTPQELQVAHCPTKSLEPVQDLRRLAAFPFNECPS